MINKSSFFGKLRKVLASVCSLVVGASGVSQAGKPFDEAVANKKGVIAHFKFGVDGESAKGATAKIFSLLHKDSAKGGFKGLLDGAFGVVASTSWGYATLDTISKLPKSAGVQFSCSDDDKYVVISLVHDNANESCFFRVLNLSFDDFDYIIGKYQKNRLPEFIKEFEEVSEGIVDNSLIEFLNRLKDKGKGIEKRDTDAKKALKNVEDIREKFPRRYCASMLALDLFSYIFGMGLNLKNPDELIGRIFNEECNYVELPSGVCVSRPEVFQDAFIRKWGYVDGKPVYELEKEINSVCKSLNVDTEGTVGEKLKKLTEKASTLLKNGDKIVELQKTIGELENQLKDAGKKGEAKEELQKKLKEAREKLAGLDPTVSELNEIGEALKGYGNESDSKVQKVRNLLTEVNNLNDKFQKLQETKLGKVAKWGSYPVALAAGYLINKFVPNGGKKLNNVNKVENRNKNKRSNGDKKAKKRNNAKKN